MSKVNFLIAEFWKNLSKGRKWRPPLQSTWTTMAPPRWMTPSLPLCSPTSRFSRASSHPTGVLQNTEDPVYRLVSSRARGASHLLALPRERAPDAAMLLGNLWEVSSLLRERGSWLTLPDAVTHRRAASGTPARATGTTRPHHPNPNEPLWSSPDGGLHVRGLSALLSLVARKF